MSALHCGARWCRAHRHTVPGVVHCFTGSRQELEACLELGLHIGITGWVCDERPERGGAQLAALLPLIPGTHSWRRAASPPCSDATTFAAFCCACVVLACPVCPLPVHLFTSRGMPRPCPADDRLLIETDCPYLTPRSITPSKSRPQRNEPALLPHVLAAVAAARGETPEQTARITTANARALFRLPDASQ